MPQELGRSPGQDRDDEADAAERVWAQEARRARTKRFWGAIPKILLGAIEIILDMLP